MVIFIRKKRNQSGSVSIQILLKEGGKNKLIKSIGSAVGESDIALLVAKAQQEIQLLSKQRSLFIHEKDSAIESFITELSNGQVRTIGPELVFGSIFDFIGYSSIDKELFRHLAIARLAFTLSKLKTIEYLYRFQGVRLGLGSVYPFLDKLNSELKEQANLPKPTSTTVDITNT